MKTIITTILLGFFISTGLFAQQTIKNVEHDYVITHVENNVYDVKFLDSEGNILQKGQYWKEGNTVKPHGTWLLYGFDSDKVITKAVYDKGEKLSIETIIDGKVVKANKELIATKNL
ncbi:hypothetical protein [Gracilimonas amylolytica]|uniref:hypothetical protein n=1 Tax=Gracilimonas amylolytica TaxID=1749045 RepID=UPI0012FFD8E5|nr:hypothetical protein [Gracilimonas amylolytica]